MPAIKRRDFLRSASASAAALAITNTLRAQAAAPLPTGDRIIIGLMGAGGRGTQIAGTFASLPNVFVKYVCDVDEAHATACAKAIEKKAAANHNMPAPTPVRDYHRILDDKEVFAMA